MSSFVRTLAIFLALVFSPCVYALSPSERLADPAQEQRARSISAELRCLVCQNQSIDDSDAELAKDLRRIVRERIVAGDSDAGVREFLVTRYGEFVLLKPVFSLRNAVLWGLPFVALLAGLLLARQFFRRSPAMAEPPAAELSNDEKAELARLLDGK